MFHSSFKEVYEVPKRVHINTLYDYIDVCSVSVCDRPLTYRIGTFSHTLNRPHYVPLIVPRNEIGEIACKLNEIVNNTILSTGDTSDVENKRSVLVHVIEYILGKVYMRANVGININRILFIKEEIDSLLEDTRKVITGERILHYYI